MFLKIIVAYFLDLLIGDPRWFPHPVKGIGKLITFLEQRLRTLISNQKIAGIILSIIVVGSTYLTAFFAISISSDYINKWAGFILESFLIFTTFSYKWSGRFFPLERCCSSELDT